MDKVNVDMASSSSASCSDSDCINYTFHELSRLGLLLLFQRTQQEEAYLLEQLLEGSLIYFCLNSIFPRESFGDRTDGRPMSYSLFHRRQHGGFHFD